MTVNRLNSCDPVTQVYTSQPVIEPKKYFNFKLLLEHCSQDYKDLFYGLGFTRQELVDPDFLPAFIRDSWDTLNAVLERGNLKGLSALQVEQLLEASTYFQITWVKKKALATLKNLKPCEGDLTRLLSLANNTDCPEILELHIRDNPEVLHRTDFPQGFFNYVDFMRTVIKNHPQAVLLAGETIRNNPKDFRVLLIEALSLLPTDEIKVHELAKTVFSGSGLDGRTYNEIDDLIDNVLKQVCDWDRRPTKDEVEAACNTIWGGILALSYAQLINAVETLKEREVWQGSTIELILILTTHSLTNLLFSDDKKSLSGAFVALNPKDKFFLKMAMRVDGRVLCVADATLQNDPFVKSNYLDEIKKWAAELPRIVKSPYFPKELYDDLECMQQVMAVDPSLYIYLGEKLLPQQEKLRIEAVFDKLFSSHVRRSLPLNDQGEVMLDGIPWSEFKRSVISAAGFTPNSTIYEQLLQQKVEPPSMIFSETLALKDVRSKKDLTKKIFTHIGENFFISDRKQVESYLPYLRQLFPVGEFEKIVINNITQGKAYPDVVVRQLSDATSEEFAAAFLDAIETSGVLIDKIILYLATHHPDLIQSDPFLRDLFDDLDFVKKILEIDPGLHTYVGKKAELAQAVVEAVLSKLTQELAPDDHTIFMDKGELIIRTGWPHNVIDNNFNEFHQATLARYKLEENERLKTLHVSDIWNTLELFFSENSLGSKKNIFIYIGKYLTIGDVTQAKLLIPYLKPLFTATRIDEKALASATSASFAQKFFAIWPTQELFF